MTIEATLERIAAALERLADKPAGVAAVQTETPPSAPMKTRAAKKEATPAPEPTMPEVDVFAAVEEPEVKLTRDDVRKALLACQERLGPAAAQAVFKKAAGVDTLPALKDESKFAAIIAAANAAA